MVDKEIQNYLEKLGIDMNSGEMQVFRAVLLAAGGTERPVDYSEVAATLETITKKTFTKAYIYRQLKSLDTSQFIEIRNTNPRTYTIVHTSLREALESKKHEEEDESLKRKQELEITYKQLGKIKSQELALMLHEQLTGDDTRSDSGVIEGVENVRSTIIREFADGAKEGDLVRVLGHASTLAEGLGPGGVTELRLIQSGVRGVKVQGLLTPLGDGKKELHLMAGHLTTMVEPFAQAARSGNIGLRFSQKPINTYRMLTLNKDKMLLYLTNAKDSDMAALIHREDNPGLIDDAIRTFDELWETGIDVLELVQQELKKQKS
ncbi:MAG: hypothetical protein ACFFF9_17495 [Candidatus Thorarchaeota archaeon]